MAVPELHLVNTAVGNLLITLVGELMQAQVQLQILGMPFTSLKEEATRLIDGIFEEPVAQPSTPKVKTAVFGKPVIGDLYGDGDEDAALILIQEPGGSGTFAYVPVALKTEGGFRGSNAVLSGDRIVPMDIKISNGAVLVRYFDRKPVEPMVTKPSVEKLACFYVQQGMLKKSVPCTTMNR